MTTIEILFAMAMIVIWGCFGITMVISSVQSFIYDRRREKRELERDARDREYHEERMKNLK
ncbi:hypothetical protein [Lachnoclostridium phytofermentans]|uniref:hypothetical protein n=1 Tax=Lachnoclostridium phytofermentans TaxID=66219 RepID=UPI0004976E2D|nr:hypothetical protein [Lachnoclostridium phytofermentans]